jgi:hypothetical protein
MNWELDALKILARNSNVPGIALKDAIGEIERLMDELKAQRKQAIFWRTQYEEIDSKHRWIPVAERLPEDNDEEYIVRALPSNFVFASYYRNRKWMNRDGYLILGITHWQPLPQPPEDDNG